MSSSIAHKEARETVFWLRLIEAAGLLSRDVDSIDHPLIRWNPHVSFFILHYTFHISATIASATSLVFALPPRSGVSTLPAATTRSIAARIRS